MVLLFFYVFSQLTLKYYFGSDRAGKMKAMPDLLKQVQKWLNFGTIHTDNSIFRLHKYTVILLMFMSIFVSSKMFFEKPMTCMSNNKPSDEVVNSYCWMSTTYTLHKRRNEEQFVQVQITFPFFSIFVSFFFWFCHFLF